MNAITFRAAYSLYPRNAFIRSVGVCFRHNNHVDTYKRRGWTMESSASGRLRRELGEEVNAPIRFVGDINTWTIDLDDRYVALARSSKRHSCCLKPFALPRYVLVQLLGAALGRSLQLVDYAAYRER